MTPPPPRDAETLQAEARQARRRGDRDAALALHRAALAVAPRRAWLLAEIAADLRALGRLEEAVRHLEELRHRAPDAVIAHTGLAAVAAARGDPAAALAHRRAALALRPGDARLAAAVEGAAAALRQAGGDDRARGGPHPAAGDEALRRAAEARERGDPAAALGHLLDALRHGPGRRAALEGIAAAVRLLGRHGEEACARLAAAGQAAAATALLDSLPEADPALAARLRALPPVPAGPFLVGLGHPRCGTAFTAGLLSRSGLAVGHEAVRPNGIVSWMLVAERLANPWGQAIGPLAPHRCFVVARSPLTAIPSIMGEDLEPRSRTWRAEVIRDRAGIDIRDAGLVPQTPVALAAASYVQWYRMILARPVGTIFRIEHAGDDAALGAFAGRPVRRAPDIATNARPYRYEGVAYRPEMLASLPAPLAGALLDVTRRLGYAEDAGRLAALLGGG